MPITRFTPFLTRWDLTADGAPIVTHSSELLPVRLADGTAGMLKVAVHPEEIWAGGLMVWWNGDGAARVLAHEGPALLLERLPSTRSLAAMARAGGAEDDEATRARSTSSTSSAIPITRSPHAPAVWQDSRT